MLLLKIVLLFIATWRLYQLIAIDRGPKNILERLRIRLGVRYNKKKTAWIAEDGSLADMITCYRCAPIWWSFGLTLLLIFAPDWVYFLVVLPLAASALVMIFEFFVHIERN